MKKILGFVPALLTLSAALAGCAEAEPTTDASQDEIQTEGVGDFDCSPMITGHGEPTMAATLVAARTAGHPGFDRFVLEFEGSVPTWGLSRQDSALFHIDPSSKELLLAGNVGLQLYVHASMYEGGWTSGKLAFDGPTRFTSNSTNLVKEAANIGDFENVNTWGIGLERPTCHRVFELQNPPRLVVDIRAK